MTDPSSNATTAASSAGESAASVKELVPLLERAVVASAKQMLVSLASPKGLQVNRKADQSLVLNIDLESQDILRKILANSLPIVSEEDETTHHLIGPHSSGEMRDYIVIDPLDGTTSCKRFMDQEGGQLGFGPLVGYVRAGRVEASVFFHLPRRTLFTGIRGQGVWTAPLSSVGTPLQHRPRLTIEPPSRLEDSAILFYPGNLGELRLIEHLRSRDLIENAYRFGGFANDCCRIASGFEQIQVQLSVKAWDFPAVLLATEAGAGALVDPLGTPISSDEWCVAESNPILIAPPLLLRELHDHFIQAKN